MISSGTSALFLTKRRTDWVKDPVNFLLLILLFVLAYLILWPFLQLIIESLTWGEGDRRSIPGEFTWFHWLHATTGPISGKMLYGPLKANTMKTGIIATTLALLVGGILAWCVVRSDMPGKSWLQPILTLPYIVPSFAVALSWEAVFRSPKVGGQPGLYEAVLGEIPSGFRNFSNFGDFSYSLFPFRLFISSRSVGHYR